MTQRTPSQPGASAPPTAARRRRNLWSRLLATVVGCLVSLLIAEVVVRSFVKVRNVGPSFTVADPVLGKRLKKNLACERITPEFRMRLRTNSDGWRGPESDGSPTCVLFLGDSFTLGYGVDDGQEYPQLVGKTLGETVVNMGIGDNGNARWRRLLRELPERSAPRAVVLQLCSNDFDDNLAEGLATLGADGGIVEHAPAPPSMLRRAQGLIDLVPGLAYSHLVGLAGQLNYQHAAPAQGAAASAPRPQNTPV